MLPRALVACALALALAGCVGTSAQDASPAPAAEEACEPTSTPLFEWATPDQGGMGIGVSDTFAVPPGTQELEIAWTPPIAFVGSYSAIVEDPRGEAVFWEEHGAGAGSGTSAVSVTDEAKGTSVQAPPPPGAYLFRFDSEGTVRGASIVAVAHGCA